MRSQSEQAAIDRALAAAPPREDGLAAIAALFVDPDDLFAQEAEPLEESA